MEVQRIKRKMEKLVLLMVQSGKLAIRNNKVNYKGLIKMVSLIIKYHLLNPLPTVQHN